MKDIVIIGGGIVGLSTAYSLSKRFPHARLTVLEKEDSWSKHQTGNNSGVIHSGIYYKPGSLKAKFANEGNKELIDFCQKHNVNYEQCGKIIVATKQHELPHIKNLYQRGIANKLELSMIGPDQIKEEEPYVQGIQAVKVPSAGIVDYKQVCLALVSTLEKHGVELLLRTEVKKIIEKSEHVDIITNQREFTAGYVVNCGGLHSDRLAKMTGLTPDLKIIPFRGEYFELKPEKQYLVKNLIYPVPNPEFPFLGVHFTRMINGGVEAGPNAVLGLKREGYLKRDINFKDAAEIMLYSGFWKMARKYWKEGTVEIWRSFSKKAFVKSLQELVPEIQESDIIPSPSGVRAQALRSNGSLVDDFFIEQSKRSINVCNAPSPAATACFPIGREIARRVPEIEYNLFAAR
jgi:(S)-2-hydroxyglutarate dehydrogenase